MAVLIFFKRQATKQRTDLLNYRECNRNVVLNNASHVWCTCMLYCLMQIARARGKLCKHDKTNFIPAQVTVTI